MILQVILAVILLGNIRKWIRQTESFRRFDIYVWIAIALFVAMPVLYFSLNYEEVWIWITHAMICGLTYVILANKVLHPVKSLLYAFLPMLVMDIVKDLIRVISNKFFTTYEDYLEIISLVAFFWMIAALIFARRQRKALAAARMKAEEIEREYRITERIKADLEVQVHERTNELIRQKEELEQTLSELKATQSQLIQSEKMASLGELTAGIAHEIQNPLNFVNNFSEVSHELIDEIEVERQKSKDERDEELIFQILDDIKQNLEKITHHGRRADAIVKGMLQHSRASSDTKEPTDINKLADEYLRLAYHGLRAKDKSFNAQLVTNFEENLPKADVVPQDIGRVLLNLFTNAFYATQKRKESDASFTPVVEISTATVGKSIEIKVKDNGTGIPDSVVEKIFQPFFTTKPTGQGTGLGLSLSYDIIVKAHGGTINIDSVEGQYSIFTISLPIK